MMRRGIFAALSVFALVAGLYLTAPAPAHAQSQGLVNVLLQIQQLSETDFVGLTFWAQYSTPVSTATFAHLRSAIFSLDDKDRQAVLWWLRGNGRSALYAQAASDAQIGTPRAPADSAAPSPSP